jgi:hypothetical protein
MQWQAQSVQSLPQVPDDPQPQLEQFVELQSM